MGRSESYGGVHLKRLVHNELILSKVAISFILFHEKVTVLYQSKAVVKNLTKPLAIRSYLCI